jgi:hypothetical protein
MLQAAAGKCHPSVSCIMSNSPWDEDMRQSTEPTELWLFPESLYLCGNKVMHVHDAGWRRDSLRFILPCSVNQQGRPRIPLAAVRGALVLGAPSRQGSPHLCPPGVISLHNERCLGPARLCLKKIENSAEKAI